MDVTVEIRNLEETMKKLALYSIQKEKELDDVVKKTSKEIASRAKSKAPVGTTGNLKASIKPKYFRKLGPSATVFPRGKKGAHRHILEYGTNQRSHKSGKNVGRVSPRPFMEPAHKSMEGEYYNQIKRVVDRNDTI